MNARRLLWTASSSVLLMAGALAQSNPQSTSQSGPPNIVLIVADDHGWRDYGWMGHPRIKTPRLDKLAAQSLVFRRGYVPTALCSPSLTSLITGRYPHEHGVTGNDPPAPPGGKQGDWRSHPQYEADWRALRSFIHRYPTLPRLLRPRGYLSLQTGKWWMGDAANGGFTGGMTHGDKTRHGRHGDEGLQIGRQTMQPITEFIGRARAQRSPFFIWYAPMLPHSPHDAPQRLLDGYQDQAPDRETARYWASVEWFDETCGQLLDALDAAGAAENTIVVYVADNGWVQGAQADTQSLRSKRTPYDAGLRTPIMLRWPRRVPPRQSRELATSLDIVPTLLAATKTPAPAGLPGLNLLDDRAIKARRALYGASFTHDLVELQNPAANVLTRWMIEGEWKLLVPTPGQTNGEQPPELELYHITADPDERNNLAAQESRRVAALRRKLDAWWDPQRK
jgi:arylsulfatase A-like enzyme